MEAPDYRIPLTERDAISYLVEGDKYHGISCADILWRKLTQIISWTHKLGTGEVL